MGGGTYLVKKREIPARAKLIAAIPFIFVFHQVTEGLVWLGTQGQIPSALHLSSVYIYTFIANAFWPTYFPLAMLYYEKDPLFRKIKLFMLFIGFLVSAYLFWCFTINDFVVAQVGCNAGDCSSLAYNFHIPYLRDVGNYIYLAVMLIPMLASSNKRIRNVISPIFLAIFIFSQLVSGRGTFPSVWCFFAAATSFIFLFIFPKKKLAELA